MAENNKPFRKLTRRLAIIAACRQCNYTAQEVSRCRNEFCALWPFRLGKAPTKDYNALDYTVFRDDPNSVIFRARKPKDGESEDEGIMVVQKEYPAYIEDEDDNEDEE